jgi:hypothetical protein
MGDAVRAVAGEGLFFEDGVDEGVEVEHLLRLVELAGTVTLYFIPCLESSF